MFMELELYSMQRRIIRIWASLVSARGGVKLASYVLLLKEYEDADTVVYKFGPDEKSMGKIELNKITRKFSQLESLPDQNIPTAFYFDRAAQRLAVCLVREGGNFPDKTAFES